jgi:sodium/hydrogen exchanger 8
MSSQIVSSLKALMHISVRFVLMFYLSGILGLLFGLISALLTKYLAFDKSSPSLEISLILLTAYASYMFAEAFHLSGIMSILVCGLTMSHYTHENLSIGGRQSITVLFRTIAFLAETCVFLYLGLGIFEYQHTFHPKLIVWTILLTLIGRAAHVFPLSYVLNCFRKEEHRITFSMQLIMWFAGLRGLYYLYD